jgi:hypothetical protein
VKEKTMAKKTKVEKKQRPEDPDFTEWWNRQKTLYVPVAMYVGGKVTKELAQEAFAAGKAALAAKF